MVASQVPVTHFLGEDVKDVSNQLNILLRFIKNDSDNGVDLHLFEQITDIASVDKADFENTQFRLYEDTATSTGFYLVTKIEEVLYKIQWTAL